MTHPSLWRKRKIGRKGAAYRRVLYQYEPAKGWQSYYHATKGWQSYYHATKGWRHRRVKG